MTKKVSELIDEAISFTKEICEDEHIICNFHIIEDGLFPYYKRDTNTIYVPKSCVPLIILNLLNADDLMVSYYVCRELIDSDLYKNAEESVSRLMKMSKAETKLNNTDVVQNYIWTQLVFLLLHEVGHLIYKNEDNIQNELVALRQRLSHIIEDITYQKYHLQYIELLQNANKELEFPNKDEYFESYTKAVFEEIQNNFKVLSISKEEELFADSVAFEHMLKYILKIFSVIEEFYPVIGQTCKVLECLAFYSISNGFIMNELDLRERFSSILKAMYSGGDSFYHSLRIDNILAIVSNYEFETIFKDEIIKQNSEFLERSSQYIKRFMMWENDNIDSLYTGTLARNEPEKKILLNNMMKTINSNFCESCDLVF